MPPLSNPKWEMFCQEYLLDLNGTQAAIRAGYTVNSARTTASTLLANPNISARVEELKEQRLHRVEIKQDDIIEELRILLKSSIDHYEADRDSGVVSAKSNAPENAIRAISSVRHKTRKSKSGEETEIEYRLWDKPKSAELLMRHMGMLNDKLKLTGDPDEPITVQNISNLTDDELAARAKELADKVKGTE